MTAALLKLPLPAHVYRREVAIRRLMTAALLKRTTLAPTRFDRPSAIRRLMTAALLKPASTTASHAAADFSYPPSDDGGPIEASGRISANRRPLVYPPSDDGGPIEAEYENSSGKLKFRKLSAV